MTYEAWRISYQSSEQAARAAYVECGRLQAKIAEMERDLRLIAETDPVDAALDPQRAVRIARAALEELK